MWPFILAVLAVVCALFIAYGLPALADWNNSVAFGKPRHFDWTQEVVVVTGGSCGLGKDIVDCIQEQARECSLRIAIIDRLDEPSVSPESPSTNHSSPRCVYYKCDLAHPEQITKCWSHIVHDLGPPTVLINNAGIMTSDVLLDHRGRATLELNADNVNATANIFQINTLSHFQLTWLFLAQFCSAKAGHGSKCNNDDTSQTADGGTLVTVSSVLGYTGAAHLSHYTASKAALLAYHASLKAELLQREQQFPPRNAQRQVGKHAIVKTILVAPGQLNTAMFAHVDPSGGRWLQGLVAGRPVDGRQLARKVVVDILQRGRGGEVRMPWWAAHVPWILTLIPTALAQVMRTWSGMDEAVARAEGLGAWSK